MKRKKRSGQKKKLSKLFISGYIFVLLVLAGFFLILQSQLTKPSQTIITNSNSPQVASAKTEEPKKLTEFKIPILMYHYVREWNKPEDEMGSKLSVSPQNFDNQMKWLKENGYQTVNPDYLLNPYSLPLKPVILSFDDGYRDNYANAFPTLKKYGFTGTFYIITGSVGYPAYMAWEMIKEMKDAGMNFGSHTVNHLDLAKATDQQIDFELRQSKKTLEEKIGATTFDFCYPSGKYDERVMNKLKELSFKTATTTHTGISDQNSNLLELPRLRIQDDTDFKTLLP